MIAVPIALVLFGYWVMYAGLKRVSLGDAFACQAQQQQTQTDQSGRSGVSVTPVSGGPTLQVTTDCRPHPGDTKLPGGLIWRPTGSGVLGQVNGILVGPC